MESLTATQTLFLFIVGTIAEFCRFFQATRRDRYDIGTFQISKWLTGKYAWK